MSADHDDTARATATAVREIAPTSLWVEELASLSPEGRIVATAAIAECLAELPALIAAAEARKAGEAASVSRDLMVPCPHCADGFTTHGDRHARTAKDVCSACGGTHQVPAATGTSPETSAPPVNGNVEATLGKVFHETGKAFPAEENETETAIREHVAAVAAVYGVPPAVLKPPRPGTFLDPEAVLYRNWRGEVRVRQLCPTYSPAETFKWCKADDYHPAGWRVRCLDAEGKHYRYYAIEGVLAWGGEAIADRQRLEAAARTLERRGFSHTPGAEEWKPPLGPAPDFEGQARRHEVAAKLRRLSDENPGRGFDEHLWLDEAARALEAVPLVARS